MVQSPSKYISIEAFSQLPEVEPANEYIDGEVIQKPMPKGRHSRLQAKLCETINSGSEANQLAYAFPELRCTYAGRSLVPDLSVYRWNCIPFTANGDVPDDFNLFPNWIIEILSPEQRPNQVLGKILFCLEHGSELGWFIDPDDLSILFLLPEKQPILYRAAAVLPVLSGLEISITVEQVFAWLKMGR